MHRLLGYKYLYPLLFFVSLAIFLAHSLFTKTAVFTDARYYYSITRSLAKDNDIDFSNEYRHLGFEMATNSKGLPVNFYPPGVSILWIPGFWIAEGVNNLINVFFDTDTSGFSFIHQLGVAVTNIFLGLSGIYMAYRLFRKFFSEKVSVLTSLTLFLTTNLFFYIAIEPITSHAISFFISSFFVYYFLLHKKDRFYYFVLGLIGGIAGLTRTQDLLILILPAVQVVKIYYKNPLKLTTNNLQLAAGFVLGFFPQIYFWRVFYETVWRSPYLNYGFNLLQPQVLYVLFNIHNGLLTQTPIIFVSVIGLILFSRKSKEIAAYSLIYFFLQLLTVSSWKDYTQGGSYSIRMMITTYPLISFGIASILEKITTKIGDNLTLLFIMIFGLLNMLMILGYLLRF